MVQPCADEEEALDLCARGMAQFMDEVDPDPIQLNQSVFAGIESHCRKVIEISNAEINASNSIESRAYYNGAKQAYRDILKMVAQHQVANEADGVEWHVGSEWAVVNGHTVAIECGQNLFTWVVFLDGERGVVIRSSPVTPPTTRDEARRQAVEAARRLNNGAH